MTSADHRPSQDEDVDVKAAGKAPVAIALAHDGAARQAPRVVAAGRGAVAERILALAFALGIRVREDADLAELLAAVDVDSEIPAAAFAAVAEILVYVYRANGNLPSFEAAASGTEAATP